MTPQRSPSVEPINSPKVSSGIEGLDEILAGGFPSHCFYLIQGDSGSGKTTLALRFLLEGIARGESGLYVTLSETEGELQFVAESHGWSLEGISLLEMSSIERLFLPEEQTTIFRPSEMEMTQVVEAVLGAVEKSQPVRVVFDSLSEFRLLAETPLRYRRQLLHLKREFEKHGSTVLLLDDKMQQGGVEDPHVLSLAHGVLDMEAIIPDYGAPRRRLRLKKMRGVNFMGGYHYYEIRRGGIVVFPRLVAATHHADFVFEPVSSNSEELDALLGGGPDRGTVTLILGPAGAGKSTLSQHYVSTLAAKGEKGIIFAFEETRKVLFHRGAALGLGLQEYADAGVIEVHQVDPAELSPGEFSARIRRAVEAGAKIVVIDSLNGYLNAMPGVEFLNNQLHELCSYLNNQGVLTFLIVAQSGLAGPIAAPIDLSYLADTVATLRYFESGGEVKKALAIVKKRSGAHENFIREVRIEAGRGLRVGAPIREFQNILSGAPVFVGSAKQIMEDESA